MKELRKSLIKLERRFLTEENYEVSNPIFAYTIEIEVYFRKTFGYDLKTLPFTELYEINFKCGWVMVTFNSRMYLTLYDDDQWHEGWNRLFVSNIIERFPINTYRILREMHFPINKFNRILNDEQSSIKDR